MSSPKTPTRAAPTTATFPTSPATRNSGFTAPPNTPYARSPSLPPSPSHSPRASSHGRTSSSPPPSASPPVSRTRSGTSSPGSPSTATVITPPDFNDKIVESYERRLADAAVAHATHLAAATAASEARLTAQAAATAATTAALIAGYERRLAAMGKRVAAASIQNDDLARRVARQNSVLAGLHNSAMAAAAEVRRLNEEVCDASLAQEDAEVELGSVQEQLDDARATVEHLETALRQKRLDAGVPEHSYVAEREHRRAERYRRLNKELVLRRAADEREIRELRATHGPLHKAVPLSMKAEPAATPGPPMKHRWAREKEFRLRHIGRLYPGTRRVHRV